LESCSLSLLLDWKRRAVDVAEFRVQWSREAVAQGFLSLLLAAE
jgi:hypothetical protein